MSRRVLLHVGCPKTGTSHLQDVLFRNQEVLREHDILYPADRFDAHFLAALDLMTLPWGGIETEAVGSPFSADTDGPAYRAMAAAMLESYGVPMTTLGQGGSIPLCNVFADTYPGAEIILMGVEEPLALIHAPNESVDPTEIERLALSEALFLRGYGAARD